MTLTALPEQSSMPDGGLLPSSAIIGKVGIDQTTPGTTDHVTASLDAAALAKVGAPGVTLTHGAGVNVATSTTAVLASNASRKYALIVNDSDAIMYVGVGVDAVLNRGLRLNPNGGSYEMSEKLGNLATGAINAIHGGTGSKVALPTEGV